MNLSQIFEPNEEQKRKMPNFVRNNVPRFLFRVHAPSSAGTIDTEHAKPPGGELEVDIFKWRPRAAAHKVRKHLQGECGDYFQGNFVSWTSSLLWALMWGFYRSKIELTDGDLSSISLFVLDTRDFPAGTFVQDLEIIEVLYQYENYPRRFHSLNHLRNLRTTGYYFGEYLMQGNLRIQGKCVQTSLERMKSHGLFRLMNGLEDKSLWWKPVQNMLTLRKSFEPFELFEEAEGGKQSEARTAIVIAESCFGGPWTVPMALYLLALKPRANMYTTIANAFEAMFTCTTHNRPDYKV